MTDSSEMGDSSVTAVAAQPQPEVVVRTVREVNGTSWSTLSGTNYGEWSVTMKVKLRARRLWNVLTKAPTMKKMTCQRWRLSSLLYWRSTGSRWGEELG